MPTIACHQKYRKLAGLVISKMCITQHRDRSRGATQIGHRSHGMGSLLLEISGVWSLEFPFMRSDSFAQVDPLLFLERLREYSRLMGNCCFLELSADSMPAEKPNAVVALNSIALRVAHYLLRRVQTDVRKPDSISWGFLFSPVRPAHISDESVDVVWLLVFSVCGSVQRVPTTAIAAANPTNKVSQWLFATTDASAPAAGGQSGFSGGEIA